MAIIKYFETISKIEPPKSKRIKHLPLGKELMIFRMQVFLLKSVIAQLPQIDSNLIDLAYVTG